MFYAFDRATDASNTSRASNYVPKKDIHVRRTSAHKNDNNSIDTRQDIFVAVGHDYPRAPAFPEPEDVLEHLCQLVHGTALGSAGPRPPPERARAQPLVFNTRLSLLFSNHVGTGGVRKGHALEIARVPTRAHLNRCWHTRLVKVAFSFQQHDIQTTADASYATRFSRKHTHTHTLTSTAHEVYGTSYAPVHLLATCIKLRMIVLHNPWERKASGN